MHGDNTAVLVGSGPNGVGGAVVTVDRATITAIDPATRMVTLQTPAGATLSIHAGDEVRNFDQLKVGDRVVSRQTEALAAGTAQGAERHPPAHRFRRPGGQRPGAAVRA